MDITKCRCGSVAKLIALYDAGQAGSNTWKSAVRCQSCGNTGPRFDDGAYSPEGQHIRAIEAWNNFVR